jgi:hypothetical protein
MRFVALKALTVGELAEEFIGCAIAGQRPAVQTAVSVASVLRAEMHLPANAALIFRISARRG